MSRKVKNDDAAELEPAQDVPDEARVGAADDAGAAGAGPAGETGAVDAAAGDEIAADAPAAGEVPGAADADADAADGAQPEAEKTAEDVDHRHEPADYEIAALAAYAAAQNVFTPPNWQDWKVPEGLLECAAAFVRGNPEVEAAVIPVELKLKGFRPDSPVPPRELAAWTVFSAALKALDAMRAIEAAEAEAQARAGDPGSTIAAPRDRLSFVPADAGLRPTGFSPSR